MTATSHAAEVPRYRYGRPLIAPPGGGEPTPYTRVSTLAKALDDTSGLMAWKQRKTAEGLLRRPDLLTRLAGILATGDPDTDWRIKKALNAVCVEATEAAAASKGASAGTGLHALTEAIDRGREPEFVTDADRVRLEAYRAATAGYEVLDVECFVVNDAVRAAGTFDRLLMCPDRKVRVADLKTGKSEADYPRATATQIATYANGSRYDPETGQRRKLHDELDLHRGILIHLPPSGGCVLYELNLDIGWEAAKAAASAMTIRKLKADAILRAVSA